MNKRPQVKVPDSVSQTSSAIGVMVGQFLIVATLCIIIFGVMVMR